MAKHSKHWQEEGTPFKLSNSQKAAARKHQEKSDCPCNRVCEHRGLIFKSLHCVDCGKQLS